MSDRPRPRIEREHPSVTFAAGVLTAAVVFWVVGTLLAAVLPPVRVQPAPGQGPPATPFHLPSEIIAYYRGEAIRLTETAPTPTPSPTPIPPPATADPMKFCGISSEKDRVCRWPSAPLPTPTPYPDCAT